MGKSKYYETSPVIKELMQEMISVDEFNFWNSLCNFKTIDDTFKFCPKCGGNIKKEEKISLYKILRSHKINNLKLSDKIVFRLSKKFDNIWDLYDADIDTIRMNYIQDVRVELIKNAVVEYMAG